MLRTANAIAETLPVAPMPRELALLPQENQLPHSLVYYTRGMLGQSLFPAGLMAKFVVASDTVGAFLVLTSSAGESLPAFQGFSASLKERGSLLAEAGRSSESLTRVAFWRCTHLHWIVGVWGIRERDRGEACGRLSANLASDEVLIATPLWVSSGGSNATYPKSSACSTARGRTAMVYGRRRASPWSDLPLEGEEACRAGKGSGGGKMTGLPKGCSAGLRNQPDVVFVQDIAHAQSPPLSALCRSSPS